MKNYFEKQFELRYFELNKFGEAQATTILTLLEETAADHCWSIDHSLYDLKYQNIGWVLLSGAIVMERYPLYKEKIIIRTWLSHYTPIRGLRENIIFDSRRNIIGRSSGLWLFFDIDRRRPARIFDDIRDKWSSEEEKSTSIDITETIHPIETGMYQKQFHVNRFDIDTYQHVNNIRYLQWMSESIPDDITDHYFMHTLNGRFLREAQQDDTLISCTNPLSESGHFEHSIRSANEGHFCAAAKTIWKKKM